VALSPWAESLATCGSERADMIPQTGGLWVQDQRKSSKEILLTVQNGKSIAVYTADPCSLSF